MKKSAKKPTKHRLKFIMMTCGYVESSMVSNLVFGPQGHSGFATHKEAIIELALDMYAKYNWEEAPRRTGVKCDDCVKRQPAQFNFCPSCGKSLKDDGFDAEVFCQFIKDLHTTDTDSYGESDECDERVMAWCPWASDDILDAHRDEVVFIAEDAEHILLAALFDAKPELKNNDYTLGDWQVEKWEAFKKGKPPSYR